LDLQSSWILLTVLVALAQGIMMVISIATTGLVMRALGRGPLRHRRIQPRAPRREVADHERVHIVYSILTGSALSALVVYLLHRGTIALDAGPTSVISILLQCALYFLVLDAYQYVIHRLMHTRLLFRHVHAVHHRSRTPSALSAYSFHPVEVFALGVYFPLALSLHTFHLYSVAIFGLGQFFMNTIPHCGYEIAPASWYKRSWTMWLLTPIFHDVHHQTSAYNFGACTTLWDRLFGTMQPDFDRRIAELHARGALPPAEIT
jgi:Delta7-sterol 5-desaturase